MYCESCFMLFDDDVKKCPYCKSRNVRPVRDDDFCFFTEVDAFWSPIFADILQQNGIPCHQAPTLGAGITMMTGSFLEKNRIFLRHSDFDAAQQLYDSLFSQENLIEEPDETDETDE